MPRLFHRFVRACALLLACALIAAPAVPAPLAAAPQFVLPPIRHVFTIVLENQSYNSTFGTSLPVPYLAQDIAGHGALLQQYYATSHVSLGNYLTLISGQAVTRDTQDDCAFNAKFPKFSANYSSIKVSRIASYDQVAGSGCIYPARTKTVADQLTAAGFTWHGYMEDMGNDPTREDAKCGQPSSGIGAPDITTNAQAPPTYNGRSVRLLPFAAGFGCVQKERRYARHAAKVAASRRLAIDRDHAELRLHHAESMQRRARHTVQNARQPGRRPSLRTRERVLENVGPDHCPLARVSA
jgi:hypothetical protein